MCPTKGSASCTRNRGSGWVAWISISAQAVLAKSDVYDASKCRRLILPIIMAVALCLILLPQNVHDQHNARSFHPLGSQQIHPVSDGSQVWWPISHLLRESRWTHQYPFDNEVSGLISAILKSGQTQSAKKLLLTTNTKKSHLNKPVDYSWCQSVYFRLGRVID